MKYLTYNDLQALSFPDCEVEEMTLNDKDKLAEIYTDGGHLNINNGKRLLNCKIILKNWKVLIIKIFDSSTRDLKTLNLEYAEMLADICEFTYGETIILKGFGAKTGKWVEYSFEDVDCFVAYSE